MLWAVGVVTFDVTHLQRRWRVHKDLLVSVMLLIYVHLTEMVILMSSVFVSLLFVKLSLTAQFRSPVLSATSWSSPRWSTPPVCSPTFSVVASSSVGRSSWDSQHLKNFYL